MKNIKYLSFFCFCLVAFVTTSCDDFLDITPDGEVKRDELLSTAQGVEDAMYGVYAQLRSTSLYGQELHFSALEVMAHNLWCRGNTTVTELGKFNYTHSNVESLFENVWTDMYENISNVNSVLNSPLVAEATEYPYCIYRGEALALRAFMHFDLVRLFAEQYTQNTEADGIPYATEFSLNTPDFESLAKNYEHILADLHLAESLLANEWDYENTTPYMTDRQIHMNLYAVQALLARVYFTMGNNTMAAQYAQAVIDAGKYTLKEKIEVEGDLAGVLSRKECIFGVYAPYFYTQVSAKLQNQTSFYSLNLRDDFMELYNKDANGNDMRISAYFSSELSGSEAVYRLSKLTDVYELKNNASARPADLILGINLIRIPEMYYILCEVLLATDDADDYATALGYYNLVREHRGLDALSQGETLTLQRLCEERDKEYIGEGQKFFNMKRLNQSINAYDGETVYAPSNGVYVVPIPEIEYENRN